MIALLLWSRWLSLAFKMKRSMMMMRWRQRYCWQFKLITNSLKFIKCLLNIPVLPYWCAHSFTEYDDVCLVFIDCIQFDCIVRMTVSFNFCVSTFIGLLLFSTLSPLYSCSDSFSSSEISAEKRVNWFCLTIVARHHTAIPFHSVIRVILVHHFAFRISLSLFLYK